MAPTVGAAAFAGTDVLNVRDTALDHLAIFVVQGGEATFFSPATFRRLPGAGL